MYSSNEYSSLVNFCWMVFSLFSLVLYAFLVGASTPPASSYLKVTSVAACYINPIPLWFLAASHQAKLSLCFLPLEYGFADFPNVCVKVCMHSFDSAPCFMNGHSTGSSLQLLRWFFIFAVGTQSKMRTWFRLGKDKTTGCA